MPRIVSPPPSSSAPLMMVLPHTQHGHHGPVRSFHPERREDIERHSAGHHSRHVLRSPHGHHSDHVPVASTSAAAATVHPHAASRALMHNPPPHSSHHVHHHSVHHPQPHYHMPPHYHMRPPFHIRSYLPGQSTVSSLKEERLDGSKASDDPSASLTAIEDGQSMKFTSLDPGIHGASNELAMNRSSPYHPVRRRGEAAAMIDISEGKFGALEILHLSLSTFPPVH